MAFKPRNGKGQFITAKAAMIEDFKFFIAEYKRWAVEALRKGDKVTAIEMRNNMREAQRELNLLTAT
ncbi:hypothetical protein D3C81_1707870 [compost metagenome]